ncbi:oligopeptide transport system permease protein [Caldanaerobius fijiensis DSM 17918]|uniref:Oligopeptide transport system permease protein n=1 Tax=Caldanaerobius fijiensis DSM 17918 TaxID=1121256 RepID=A0A1M5CHH6_9THEO|nr:ABC transporter permease [Caldanaerobius fijiensis]SHF54179.1 oligopeptide transport system permease protein [Caldanaerobius fijiensis DSM 17918]
MGIFGYILRRIGYALLTLWVILTFTFILMHMLPGKPYTGMKQVPVEIQKNLDAKYGLDKPLVVQYYKYLANILRGDFGMSMLFQNQSVEEIIAQGFPVSAALGLEAMAFAAVLGMLLGIISAVRHNTGWDYFATVVAVIGVSVPSFIIGALLQYFLGVKIRLFPVAGWGSFKFTILPSISLGLGMLATISRMMRASMLDVLNQDYIKTAKSKGLSNAAVIWKHAVRNAILPVVTTFGPIFAIVVTGTFVVENIFGVPGLGKHYVTSINSNDYTLIMGLTIFFAVILIGVNLLVDILYGVIDPRIRITKEKG